MKKLIITEEERKDILTKHVENGHTVSEQTMSVSFVTETNGLEEKKEETNEGPLDTLKDVGAGLKGVWRGEGYDYYKHLSSLKNMTQNLKRLDKPNHKIMTSMNNLKSQISASKMPTPKKDNLMRVIDSAQNHFNSYTNLINQIEVAASQKLN